MADRPEVSGTTQLAAVIGHPVRHSRSPILHNAAFAELGLDWVFVALDVLPEHGHAAVRAVPALGIRGLSVTMPHKDAAAAAVDELSPAAQALGAVNCVINRNGVLVGENTDGDGFIASLRIDHGVDPADLRCVVVGAGGAARSVIRALAGAGAREVAVVNRTSATAERAASLAGNVGRVGVMSDLESADLVVNATPIGMLDGSSDPGAVPFDPDLVGTGQIVADLIVHPVRTEILARAEQRGARPIGGMGMLVHQAALAFTHWTGEPAPLAAMWDAVKDG